MIQNTLPIETCAAPASSFLDEVISGLYEDPRHLPSKFFYDEAGSKLFDKICHLEEYYLTDAELEIMHRFAPQMASLLGGRVLLMEFGSGSGRKTRLLLDHMSDAAAYVPVDVSSEQLEETAEQLAIEYPALEVLPVCADFTRLADVPSLLNPADRRVVYFPGSTIGNFAPLEREPLLSRIAECCGVGGAALIGIDLKKDVAAIHAAYNDSQGVTEQFNLNLLRRINRELGADFQIDQFRHQAKYNDKLGRIEMYLVSDCSQTVSIRGNHFEFVAGDAICTEYSYKYTVGEFADIAARARLALRDCWRDIRNQFAVMYFEVLP